MNPIFAAMNNSARMNPMSNFSNFVNQFNQFRSQFQGDPKAQVENLLSSGKMSKEQFEQFSNIARQFQGSMGVRK